MASFFKTLFRKDEDSQPVPDAPLIQGQPAASRPPVFQEEGTASAPLRHGLPTGQSGPFSAVSGRHMTAREIAALLPPALLRYDGISPDQPVALPLGALRDSMLAGRPVLLLSQIGAACPELFQRLPLPEEDVEITLPLARIKGILEFSAPMTPIAPTSSAPAPPAPVTAALPDGNPFATIRRPGALPGAGSPFATASAPVAAALGNPFAAAVPLAAAAPFPVAAANPFPGAPAGLQNAPIPLSAAPAPGLPPQLPAAGSPPSAQAQPVAGGSPFAALKPSTLPAPRPVTLPMASPFALASAPAAVPAPSPAGSTSPFALAAAPASPPPVVPTPFSIAAAAPPTAPPPLNPSPFAAPSGPSTFPEAAVAAPSAAAGQALSWPPPARAAAIVPQPRTAAVPAHRSASVAEVGSAPLPGSAPVAAPLMVSANLPPVSPTVESAPLPAAGAAPLTAPLPSPFFTTAAPATAAIPESPAAAPVELSLRAVLRDADPAELGFVPDNVPENVRVSLPLEIITRQLATGRVEISLDELRAGISEKFRPAFARAQDGLRINIPMSEVFHTLPESERPSLPPTAPAQAHMEITTSPFQTPFAIKAEEDTSRHLLDLSITGFNPAHLAVRPSTHPVPPAVLPPAPLPLVPPPVGGTPAVHVDLPVLRPVASAAAGATPLSVASGPAPAADSPPLPPLLPRPGLLSRPPGSGTTPTEAPALLPAATPAPPKSPPRLKPVPASPTALRAFPKPANPHHHENGTAALPSAVPLPLRAASAPQAELSPLGSAAPAPAASPSFSAPVLPPSALSLSSPETADDLGESYSAASLSAEPPPRAGSAPVGLPSAAAPGSVPVHFPVPVSEAGVSAAPLPPISIGAPWPTGEIPVPPPVAKLAPSAPTAWPAPAPALAPISPPPAATAPAPVPAAAAAEASSAAVAFPLRATSTSPLEDLTFGCVTDLTQLTLRAVLGTDQFLSPQDIVDRCAAFPGLQACLLLQAGSILTSHGMDDAEAAAFRASATQTRDSLAHLAATLGLGTKGNFTLRTDHGIRSFFLDSGLCLAVSHSHPQFSGGTLEKLILISQELSKFQLPSTSPL